MLRGSWWGGLLPLLHHRLLTVQDGAGYVNGSHPQVWAVLALADHAPDTAEGSRCILAAAGPYVGGGGFPRPPSPLHDHHYSSAVGHWRHAHSLAVNQLVVAE